jgi:hypothetical protein
MLQIVGNHTYEPDTEGDRRVPPLVHDPIKIGVCQAPDELEGVEADSVVVRAQELRVGSYGSDLVGTMAVARVRNLQWQGEALRPAR